MHKMTMTMYEIIFDNKLQQVYILYLYYYNDHFNCFIRNHNSHKNPNNNYFLEQSFFIERSRDWIKYSLCKNLFYIYKWWEIDDIWKSIYLNRIMRLDYKPRYMPGPASSEENLFLCNFLPNRTAFKTAHDRIFSYAINNVWPTKPWWLSGWMCQ